MGRNTEQNQQMREQSRQQILTAALHLFAQKGLAKTTIADIATAAGVSQGLMYHYFKSKQQLFTTIINQAFSRLNAATSHLIAMDLSPAQKIRLALTELLKGLKTSKDAPLYHLLIAQTTNLSSTPQQARQIIAEQSLQPYHSIAKIMQQGIDSGQFTKADPWEMSLLFWSTIRGIAIFVALHGSSYPLPNPDLLLRSYLKNPE